MLQTSFAIVPPILTVQQFTIGDLIERLEPLSQTRRRALLFGLEMDLTPSQIVLLEPQAVKRMKLTPFAAQLVQAQPRHVRLNYLFWEFNDEGKALPLYGLERQVQRLNWAEIMDAYPRIIRYDGRSERLAFCRAFSEALQTFV